MQTNLTNSVNSINTVYGRRDSINLNSWYGKQSWGCITRCFRTCTLFIAGYSSQVLADNNDYVIDPGVPNRYTPWGMSSLVAVNGAWENDRNIRFELNFSDIGNGNSQIHLVPLNTTVPANQYIHFVLSYVSYE